MKRAAKYLYPLLAALLATAVIGMGALQRVDKWAQDRFCQHRGVTSGDIIIIGIDEDALAELGPYNTWDRNVMASALEALAVDPDNLPAVVAVDVLYAGESSAQADARLAEAASALDCVITATMAVYGENIVWENGHAVSLSADAVIGYDQPFAALRDATTQGHINAMIDRDGVLRHALLYVEPGGERVYSMASQAARVFLEKRGEALSLPPVNAKGHFYVPFTGLPGDYYDGVSIASLIAGRIPAGYWANKIVLIGPYATALQDAYFTTIDKGEQMYGVEFQANVIQSLLERNFKREVSDLPQLIALFVLSAAAMALFLRMKVGPGGGLCAGLIALGVAAAPLLYRAALIVHPLWLPASALALYIVSVVVHYVRAAKERQALALEKERIDAELALATRIQANSLPKVFPPFPEHTEFDIFASMTPAKEVGGDFYDFFLIDDDHMGMVIADVSGKGVPAALFMMLSKALIHNAAMGGISPSRALQDANHQICANNPEEMFVTVWLGVLEISTGKLTAANAGHEYPIVKTPGGRFETLKDRHGFVLGGMEGTRYREYELQMEPGTKLFVYTDGLTEATNAGEEMMGMDRIVSALQACGEGTPGEIVASVNRAVKQFVGAAPQFDDLTMLCLQYNGAGQA